VTALLLAAGLWAWPTAAGGARNRAWPELTRLRTGRHGVPVTLVSVAGVVGMLAYLVSGVPAVALSTAVVGVTVGRLVVAAARVRRRARERAEILEAVRAIGREVRAGADLDTAVAAVRDAHGPTVSALLGRLGAQPLDRAGPSARDCSGAEYALTAAVELARRFGAPLTVLLAGVADGLTDEVRAAEQRSAAVAGARLSGWVLAGLPVMGVLLGAGMGADPIPVLLGGGLGSVLLLAGTVLLCAGLLWSARIAR
jgi:tight adherence protein B